jgi:hypothetical protein
MYSIQFEASDTELGLLCEIMTQRKAKIEMALTTAKAAHANMEKDEVMAQAYGIYVERVQRDFDMVVALIAKIESNL